MIKLRKCTMDFFKTTQRLSENKLKKNKNIILKLKVMKSMLLRKLLMLYQTIMNVKESPMLNLEEHNQSLGERDL